MNTVPKTQFQIKSRNGIQKKFQGGWSGHFKYETLGTNFLESNQSVESTRVSLANKRELKVEGL